MRGLRHLRIPQATIEIPGGDEFAVRGLSLPDVLSLAATHGPALAIIYETIKTRGAELTPADLHVLAKTLLEKFPQAAYDIVLMGAGSTPATYQEDLAALKSIPFPCAIEALGKIGEMTFVSEDMVKKVLEIVIQAVSGARKTIENLRT